ncbi:MAG TPA: helix-turn-helix domain-containing protein [Prolixibacteraceae bacterium]|nr:helix-turn-helix domain-containing protein [Prolixibacteraceae bacterium]
MKEIVLMLAQVIKLIKELMELTKSGMNVQPLAQIWLDTQDVSTALHISPRTLQTLRDNGTLPYSRIKNKIYYKVSDVHAMLESSYFRNIKGREKREKKI